MAIVEHAWLDIVRAVRTLRRSPTFTFVVTLTLAIGIGANAAVISLIDRIAFRKIPVPQPEQLFAIFSGDSRDGANTRVRGRSSLPDFRDLAIATRGAADLAFYSMAQVDLGGELAGSSVLGAFVTGNYFTVLRAAAARGRLIAPDEEQPLGGHPVVVVGDRFWKSRLRGDPSVVGREITIGSARFTVIGITPPGFVGVQGEGRTDLWLPYTMQAVANGDFTFDNRDARLGIIVGRLSLGSKLTAIQTRLDQAMRSLAVTYPSSDGSLRLLAMRHDRLVPIEQAPFAYISALLILAMVVLLHMVACSNVATLILARATARRRELGIRLSLGATPGRILAQSLAEPLVLAALGATGGIVVARLITRALATTYLASAMDPGLDLRVVAIVAITAALTALGFGFFPARATARSDPLAALQGTPDGRTGGRRDDTLFLITGQVVVSLMLLANAGVLMRTFQRQASGNPGFDPEHLAWVHVQLQRGTGVYRDLSTLDDMMDHVARVPGVMSVSLASGTPLYQAAVFEEVTVPDYQYAQGERSRLAIQMVGPGYFSTVGATIGAGREFLRTERRPPDPRASWPGFSAAIVNETMARQYWPGADPIGKRILFRGRGATVVVGVVRDFNDVRLSTVFPRVYFPILEWRIFPEFHLVVRTAGDPQKSLADVQTVVAMTTMPIQPPSVGGMDAVLDDALALPRIGSICLAIGGGLALLLTTMGLYGLVVQWTAQRKREIGIRIALGAEVWDIHRLMLGTVTVLVGSGVLIGLAAAISMIRVEQTWWGPGIVLEVMPMLLACLVLGIAAGLAAYWPSRRAAATDPRVVLQAL